MPILRLTLKMILWICLFIPSPGQSQSTLNVHAGSLYAHNFKNPFLEEDEIVSMGFGYHVGIDFNLQPENWKFVPGIGIGYKKLYTSGTVGAYDFSSETSKLTGLIYCHFLLSENWEIGLIGMVENNKDFIDFVPFGGDHFRYNAGLGLKYEIDHGMGAYLRYTRSINPNQNIYLIQNPSDQIMLSLFYKLFNL